MNMHMTREQVRKLYPSAAQLRTKWTQADERDHILTALKERGVELSHLASAVHLPDADPFDLLVHVAYNGPLRTRRERAERVRKGNLDAFDYFKPEAREILGLLLEKYCDHGVDQLSDLHILEVSPISQHGTPVEIAQLFGGADKLRGHFPNLGLMYFDGDVDLHTPADTPSGIFDGMGMAHIIGEGADELTRLGPRYPLLPQESIILFGYNLDAGWIDAIEVERLQQCSMTRYPVTHIRDKAISVSKEALERLENRVAHILVHFDVDVITHNVFPVADVPHLNGLTFPQALDALRIFVSSPKFAGLVITEFNAERDMSGIYAEQLVTAVTETLQKGNSYWMESNVA